MRLAIILLFLIPSLPIQAQEANNEQHPASQFLEEVINNSKCMGIAGAYAINGKTIWQDAAGRADEERQLPFFTDTQTRIASILKPMTAVAVMQLVEAGKIDLDKKIVEYISDFPKTNITVRQVMNHSAGIRAYKNGKERNNRKNFSNLNEALKIFIDSDLLFEPGTQFAYSTYGYVILGILIEKVSQESYESYMQKNIWDKVNMEKTGIEKFGVNIEGKATFYHKDKKGRIRPGEITNISDRIPGGGIYSTATDLIKFGNAILDGSLISKASVLLMQENLGLKKEGNGYGLGWYLYGNNPKLGNIFGHNGAQMGSSCWLMLLPDRNAVVTVVSNTSGALQETFKVIMDLFGLVAEEE